MTTSSLYYRIVKDYENILAQRIYYIIVISLIRETVFKVSQWSIKDGSLFNLFVESLYSIRWTRERRRRRDTTYKSSQLNCSGHHRELVRAERDLYCSSEKKSSYESKQIEFYERTTSTHQSFSNPNNIKALRRPFGRFSVTVRRPRYFRIRWRHRFPYVR